MSTIPFLVAAVISFPAVAGHQAFRSSKISSQDRYVLCGYAILMACWLAIAAILGYRGLWLEERVLATLPGLWLPLIPVLLMLLPLASTTIRTAVFRAGQAIPRSWFAVVQAVRVAAIGTAIKTYHGEFPEMVEYFVGVPDLLFGISAFWFARFASKLTRSVWVAWNAIGFGIIVPFGMVVINMNMPGPMNMLGGPPNFLVALEFPLSLAPTAIVPWLIMFNLWAIVSAWQSDTRVPA